MANPVTISKGGVVVINDENVIVTGLPPVSLYWNQSLLNIFLYNQTSKNIPVTNGVMYYDNTGTLVNIIPANTHLQLVQFTDGSYHDLAGTGYVQDQGGNPGSGGGSSPYTLPPATISSLGGVIPDGATITVDGDGTIHAVGSLSQIQSDWNQSNNVLPDFIKNKPAIPAAQVNSDWSQSNPSSPAYIQNKPSIPSPYTLPAASAGVRGGIRVGSGLSIAGDVLSAPGGTPISLTTVGSSGAATLLSNVLNIPVYSGGGASVTSFPSTQDLGIGTVGDQTASLNSALSNSQYKGIVIDLLSGGAIIINGTVNAGGKVLLFRSGTYFTGSGTINQAVLDGGYRQKFFDQTISLTACSSAPGKFSVLWFGTPLGSADTNQCQQRSIDTVIANPLIKTVSWPSGQYQITAPLIVYSWNGSNYAQVTVSLEGEESFWNGTINGTVITLSGFKDTFALGIQKGKGVEVKKIKFIGLFAPPFTSGYAFYTCTFANFRDGSSRDETYSPYSGIVVDPFGTSIPTDGGYPGLGSFYRGSGTGGSTGVIIEDVFLSNFVIGIITSPNGQTANAELMRVTKIQFAAMKACIVGCQDQEKLNVVEFAACWSASHTFFYSGVSGGYGAVTPGNWYIKGVNIAGALNTLIQRRSVGYFPMYMSDVYAEEVGIIGQWDGTEGDSMDASTFNFVQLGSMPAYPSSYHFNCAGRVEIRNTSFRYYGTNYRPVFNGGSFLNCSFNDVPMMIAGSLKDCKIYNGAATGIANPAYDITDSKANFSNYYACGRYSFMDSTQLAQGKEISMFMNKNTLPIGMLLSDGINNTASTVVVVSNVATVTPPTANDLNRITVGGLIMAGSTVFGIVTAIGGSTYTVSYVPFGVVSGSYVLAQAYSIYGLSFLGTITSGSPTITGVVADFGSISSFISKGGFCRIQGFYQFRAYSQGARMLSYDSGAGTITMDRNASQSGTNIYFSNNQAVKNINQTSDGSGPGSTIPNAEIFPKGSRFYDELPTSGGRREYIITDTGYYVNVPTAVMNELT